MPLRLFMFLSQTGNDVQDIIGVRVDALDEVGVNLDLLKLIAVAKVTIPTELLLQVGDLVDKCLALAVALRLGRRRGSAGLWLSGSAPQIGDGCFVGCHCSDDVYLRILTVWRCNQFVGSRGGALFYLRRIVWSECV